MNMNSRNFILIFLHFFVQKHDEHFVIKYPVSSVSNKYSV